MTATDGNGFTQKEMLVRIDAKLDQAIGRVTAVELRQAVLETKVNDAASVREDAMAWRDEVRGEVASIRTEQAAVSRKLAYATGTVSAVVLLANWLIPAALRAWTGA